MWWKHRHITLLALVFCLLTGSVGVSATQQFCAMLGMSPTPSVVAKMQQKGCCQNEKKSHCAKEQTQVESNCCSTSTTFHKLDVTASLKFSKVELLAIEPLLFESNFLTPPVLLSSISSEWPLYSDTSPPNSGRELLQKIQLLRI